MEEKPIITTQKLTEEIYKKNVELLEQRRHAEQLLYGVSEGVFVVDTEMRITLFNHTMEKFLGKPADQVINLQTDEVIEIRDKYGNKLRAADYCFQGDPQKATIENAVLKCPEGERYVIVKTNIIARVNTGKECLVTLVDMTKEKLLEKAKDEFISITSHELRTPITIIKSYLWMLEQQKGGTLTETQQNYLHKAIKGTERMLNLVNDTLNIARIEQGKITVNIEQVDLPSFLKELEEEMKVKTDEKALWLRTEITENPEMIYADKSKLREILINFIGNSVKFTQKGGITVRVENQGEDFVKVSVVDTGKGLQKEDLPKLFNKFGRLDNSYQTIAEAGGTGLGLYISKQLVEKMGGHVGAESEGKGKGSTFWFTLPAVNPHAKICSLIHGKEN